MKGSENQQSKGDTAEANCLLVAGALRDAVVNRLKGNLAQVSALDLSANADELLAEGILARGVHHLLLKLGGVRAPARNAATSAKGRKRPRSKDAPSVEADLVALAAIARVPLKVKDGIAALLLVEVAELGKEVVVRGVLSARLLNNDLGHLVVDLEEHILVLAAGLQLIVALDGLIVDDNTRRLARTRAESAILFTGRSRQARQPNQKGKAGDSWRKRQDKRKTMDEATAADGTSERAHTAAASPRALHTRDKQAGTMQHRAHALHRTPLQKSQQTAAYPKQQQPPPDRRIRRHPRPHSVHPSAA